MNFAVPLGSAASAGRTAPIRIAPGPRPGQSAIRACIRPPTHSPANMRNLAQFFEQYKAYQETRKRPPRNLEQQLAEFRFGRAIFLNVSQAITDWGNAVSSEAQALAQYNIELANLERQTGTILETHGVQFVEERYKSIGPLGRCAE